MTRAQIDDVAGFAGAVGFAVRRDGMSVEDAIAKMLEPHLLAPHGCHRDGDSFSIRDAEGGEAVYFTKNDQDELWVSATHRNGARITPDQFHWLVTQLSPWLDGRDVKAVRS